MVDKNAFLKAYNIDEEDFKAADISWEELAAIYDDYLSIEGGSVKTLSMIISMILSGPGSIPTVTVPKIQDTF